MVVGTLVRVTALHVTDDIVSDEVFKPRCLVICQLTKLHATSPHSNGCKRDFAGSEIRNGFKSHVIQIEIVLSQEYVQPV